ncbi:hypothetical protein GFM29_09915 [Rhizobium leguminosarum bv. viciae]|nr:hypothetical protein [Rhizobium leguminosarum bv. viciae]
MKAIFHERFEFDRRPKQAIAFVVEPSTEPQNLPHDVVEAAVEAGKATTWQRPSPKNMKK